MPPAAGGAAAEHFDTIIVGSGFGGSVMAARLAEAGKSVCLLERGKAYAPGDFPRSPAEMSKAFWDPSEHLHGMFNVWSFEKFGALVSSGLGGGSLIYANVMLRKPENWFVERKPDGGYEEWPVTYAMLEQHYERVEKILGANELPYDVATHALTSKGRALMEAAAALGLEWKPAPLAVTFGGKDDPIGQPLVTDPHNLHGRVRTTCRMCGECNIGCNYGSKNTLDHTYLSIAKRHGAKIQARSEVRSFAREPNDGYAVDFVEHSDDPDVDVRQLKPRRYTCDRLVLAAGALGTPYLLLKNREHTHAELPMLGKRFCTNGDLLTLVVKSRDGSDKWRKLDPSRGPVITGHIGISEEPTRRGYYVEDAGIPDIVAWIVHMFDAMSNVERGIRLAKRWTRGLLGGDRDRNLSAEFSAFFGDCELSTSSLPLLGMGRDLPTGEMSLVESGRRRLLQVDWSAADSGDFFPRMRETMKDLARKLDGKLVDAPVWNLGRVITVHPLGGCPMGRTKENGVVDSNGRVFGAGNLFIADGSVMPGPVGPNPALTIAALADRFADGIISS